MARTYFISLILNFCLVAGQDTQYVLKGTEAKFVTKISSTPDEILWKHDGDKVIEFNGREEKVFKQYENRVTLLWDSAAIIIADVRYEDSGLYELDAFIRGQLHRSQFRMKVIDVVTKPIVSCKLMDERLHNASGQQARLMCSSVSQQPQQLMYQWHSNGKVQPGQELTISVGDKHDDDEHRCTVSNPVHTETTTFITKECYPEESSAPAVTGIVVALVLLLLFVICGAVFYYRKQLFQACPGRGQSDDVEKQRKVLNERATHEEHRPLVHRQSTMPSQQPLRNFQNNQNDSDQDHPEEIPDLQTLKERKLVQKNRGIFDTSAHTTPLRRDNGTKKREETMSPPALPTNQSFHEDRNDDENKGENLERTVKESEPANDAVQSSEDEQSPAASEQPEDDKEKREETMSPPALPTDHSRLHQGQNDENKGDNLEPSAKESEPANDAAKSPEDEQSDEQSPAASEQPESDKGKGEETMSPPPRTNQWPPRQDVDVDKDKGNDSDPITKESEPANDAAPPSEDKQSDEQSPAASEQPENDREKCEETVSPPPLQTDQSALQQDRNDDENKGDNLEPSAKESEPANDAAKSPEVQSPAASEQPASEKKEDENEKLTSLPPTAVPSSASPRSPLSQSAQMKETKDTDDEHKNDSSSDEVTKQTEEKNIRESDSSGAGDVNESEEPSVKKQPAIPEQKGSEILSQKDEKSAAENECGSESEMAKETNPSLDAAGSDLDQESNEVCQESKGQSDSSAAKDDKNNDQRAEKNDVECGSVDKESGSDHESQERKEQKADAVAKAFTREDREKGQNM